MRDFLLIFLTVQSFCIVSADIELSDIFGDNMVLQRDALVPVWGEADPGEEVVVSVDRFRYKTVADNYGHWKIVLDSFQASGPYNIILEGKNRVVLENVMFGDVWLCSGQSNMEWTVSRFVGMEDDIKSSDNSLIRFFTVKKQSSNSPVKNVNGSWSISSPKSVRSFSAVSYFFGRELNEDLGVPIGLVNSSWGGTSYQWWTPRKVFKDHTELGYYEQLIQKSLSIDGGEKGRQQSFVDEFIQWAKNNNVYAYDISEEENEYAGFDCSDKDWQTVRLPKLQVESPSGQRSIVVWYRKIVDIPEEWIGGDLALRLGMASEYDRTYFNGVLVGKASLDDYQDLITPRMYDVPSGIVKPGKNVISIRVYDPQGRTSMTGKAGWMFIRPERKVLRSQRIELTGNWKCEILESRDYKVLSQKPFDCRVADSYRFPSSLFNGMVFPLKDLALKGVVWYQGENNAADEFEEYRYGFQAMIEGWRYAFQRPELPFLFVQLAGYENLHNWAFIREAQEMALELPNTGMSVAIDIGEKNNIHPHNKQELGRRLALIAKAEVYGLKNNYTGPIFQSYQIVKDGIVMKFVNVEGRLQFDSGQMVGDECFEIVDNADKSIAVNCEIVGSDMVKLYCDDLINFKAIRYDWRNFPSQNLIDSSGLSARPFRTDKPVNPYCNNVVFD